MSKAVAEEKAIEAVYELIQEAEISEYRDQLVEWFVFEYVHQQGELTARRFSKPKQRTLMK